MAYTSTNSSARKNISRSKTESLKKGLTLSVESDTYKSLYTKAYPAETPFGAKYLKEKRSKILVKCLNVPQRYSSNRIYKK